ncbi:isoprenylcysteine carboxyl methyltransferase family protein [Bacillaceae bacterium W0354]
MIYLIIFVYLISMRLVELVIAKSNERFQKQRGAFEVKDPYYKLIVLTHILFFISLIMESYYNDIWDISISIPILIIFLLLQLFRIWCIASLGRYWNTKIIILPDGDIVKKGPYKWFSHPNYLVVGLEFIIIPIMFNAFVTTILFLSLHLLLMRKRIPMENEALKTYITS